MSRGRKKKEPVVQSVVAEELPLIAEPAVSESKVSHMPVNRIDCMWINAHPIYYAKLQGPAPIHKNQEPVYEFRLESKDKKYIVEEMRVVLPEGHLLWKSNGEFNFMPSSNVLHVRVITS